MDARLKIEGPEHNRFIKMKELYTDLGTTLAPDEVISFVQIPKLSPESKQRFLKFRRRKTIDFAVVSVGAVLHFDEKKRVKDARLALGGVSYSPVRAHEAEQILIGEPITEKVAEKASEAAVSGFHPLSKNAYKTQILKTLVKRTLVN
jgi:xanthine dehydrogenase YagS FAD-binding subunit